MKMATGTRIFCPECHKEILLETEGLLGGLIAQMLFDKVLDRVRREGAKVTCNHCRHVWQQAPMRG